MTEMRDRVARAICNSHILEGECWGPECGCWKAATHEAKAAIAALREPSVEMTQAAHEVSGVSHKVAILDWCAMIDKALEHRRP